MLFRDQIPRHTNPEYIINIILRENITLDHRMSLAFPLLFCLAKSISEAAFLF